ncbi:regulatory protein RecX [Vulgatibacter sp.]|uniref:regulatory protein RecX n=1 Tax=Vulgatibacter sp. TaxID=1971226 RepID=UPI00356A1E10
MEEQRRPRRRSSYAGDGVAQRRRPAAAGAGPARRERKKREPLGDRYEPALELSFAYIAARPRSEAEVRRRLARAEAAPATIDRVIERLGELRYLDDAAFARARAGSLARRGFGPRAIAVKLSQAGVRGEAARQGTSAGIGEDERELARAALEKRLKGRAFAALDRKEQARLARWLAGRGFSPGAVRAACERAGSFDPDSSDV